MDVPTKISIRLSFLFLFLSLGCAGFAQAGESQEANTLTFYQENDIYSGTDRDYTNGLKFTWISQDLSEYRQNPHIPVWSYPLIENLPFVNEPGFQRTFSLSLGQNIYTPEDLQKYEQTDGDRPYAGIMYLEIGFHSRNYRRMDTIAIDIGIIGPHSYAEKSQKAVHEWTGSHYPNGWDSQIKDEPILNLYYERKWKFIQGNKGIRGFDYDFVPHIGCAVGNAFTGINAGGQLRFGWNLPNDFGTFIIRPGSDTNAPLDVNDPRFFAEKKQFGIHIFAAIDSMAVQRNITLDGNLMRSSYHVDKEPFVASFACGVGMIIHRFKITYSYVFTTKVFETQEDEQNFGAVTISYTF